MSQDPPDPNVPDGSATRDRYAKTTRYDCGDADEPSLAVVDAVAAATGRDQTDLPPLHRSVDTDALDALVAADGTPVTVTFSYAGTDILVRSDGTVEVTTE